VQNFILQQNRARFLHLLQGEADEARCATLRHLLRATERDLAFNQALRDGAGSGVMGRRMEPFAPNSDCARHFRETHADSPHLRMALDPGPGLHIIEVNAVFEREGLHPREALIGQPLFSKFPDNPDDPSADGMSALYASLRMAVADGEPQVIPAQRYDVQGPDGVFVERHWRCVNTPVFDPDGRLLYVLHDSERLGSGAS
jgi:hypothetical protein